MQPQEADFMRVLIPRPMAYRWAKNGFREEDIKELVFWCRAAYQLDYGKRANFETWLAQVLR